AGAARPARVDEDRPDLVRLVVGRPPEKGELDGLAVRAAVAGAIVVVVLAFVLAVVVVAVVVIAVAVDVIERHPCGGALEPPVARGPPQDGHVDRLSGVRRRRPRRRYERDDD